MPKAHTLLPPALDPIDAGTSDAESRSLEGVGVHAVLGAMIEQRRASQVSALELDLERAPPTDEEAPPESEAPRAKRTKRDGATSDVFLKAR